MTFIKLEKIILSILLFLFMKIMKNIKSVFKEKCCGEKHVDLLLIGEKGKRHYVLFKDFDTVMYDYVLHRVSKHCCCYCL